VHSCDSVETHSECTREKKKERKTKRSVFPLVCLLLSFFPSFSLVPTVSSALASEWLYDRRLTSKDRHSQLRVKKKRAKKEKEEGGGRRLISLIQVQYSQ
jgi:hypothetical protein